MRTISVLILISVSALQSCQPKNNADKIIADAIVENNDVNFLSIDHVPIVVNNLDTIERILKTDFHFTIKNGREHFGIKNCFIKFSDGTYLEFILPTDSTKRIGAYYQKQLAEKQGGTSLAIAVHSVDSIKQYLNARKISYTTDSNSTWKTLMPDNMKLFYIEYADQSWKDNEKNTTHSNNAHSLQSVWYISENMPADIMKFTKLGLKYKGKSSFLNISTEELTGGSNNLFLIDANDAKKIAENFRVKHFKGISGFSIRINSLPELNKLLPDKLSKIQNKNQTICFLTEQNFFLDFRE